MYEPLFDNPTNVHFFAILFDNKEDVTKQFFIDNVKEKTGFKTLGLASALGLHYLYVDETEQYNEPALNIVPYLLENGHIVCLLGNSSVKFPGEKVGKEENHWHLLYQCHQFQRGHDDPMKPLSRFMGEMKMFLDFDMRDENRWLIEEGKYFARTMNSNINNMEKNQYTNPFELFEKNQRKIKLNRLAHKILQATYQFGKEMKPFQITNYKKETKLITYAELQNYEKKFDKMLGNVVVAN